MPPINLSPFLGYSTKPDAVLDEPRIASDCNNVIIHNGDICNFPFNKKQYNANRFLEANAHILGMYYDNRTKKGHLVYFDAFGRFFITDYLAQVLNPNQTLLTFINMTGEVLRLNIPIAYPENLPFDASLNGLVNPSATLMNAMSGNFVQVGDWLFFLAPTGSVDLVTGTTAVGQYLPRAHMAKFRVIEALYTVVERIGLYAPYRIAHTHQAGGSIDTSGSDIQWAITFVRQPGLASNVAPTKAQMLPTGAESTATVSSTSLIGLPNSKVVFEIHAPLGIENNTYVVPSFRIGIYVKLTNQSIYYLVHYTEAVQSTVSFNATYGTNVVQYIFDTTTPLSTLQEQFGFTPAPLTGLVPIAGAHDVPRLCYHGAYFKNRMYYTCSSAPRNLLQYSARTPVTDVETGQFAQYIEGIEQVGDESESLTGLVNLQGQLIIFRETSTWVLTDDITTTGSLRPLLSDVGCVNVDGGQGYIVINNILYFVSRDGIYSYDGGEQVDISEMIFEDLLKISRLRYSYVRLRHDPRYNLLKVCFPLGKGCDQFEEVPTFIYSYADKQWTKIDHLDDVAIDKRSTDDNKQQVNVWVARKERLSLLGLITENEVFDNLRVNWFWKSSLLDMQYGELLKAWQQLHIETIPNTYPMNLIFTDGEGNIIGDPHGNSGDAPISKLRNIGAHSKALSVKLSNDELSNKPFRINRMKLQAMLTGIQ